MLQESSATAKKINSENEACNERLTQKRFCSLSSEI